jgi:hypothetical protein
MPAWFALDGEKFYLLPLHGWGTQRNAGLAKLPHGTHNQVRLIDCRAAMADGDPCTGFVVFELVARLMDQHPRPVAFLASKT